jgi:hypothetical protein
MNFTPYQKFWIKSFAAFAGAITVTGGVHQLAGQISLIDWLALLWPGIVAVFIYWGSVADSTPAPWVTKEEAHATAECIPEKK